MPDVVPVSCTLCVSLWDLASLSSLTKHCIHPDDKDHHLQCLSHHKAVHLGSATVKVMEQIILLLGMLSYWHSVNVWWNEDDNVNWKCECNRVRILIRSACKCFCCCLQCFESEVLTYFRPFFQISVSGQTTAVSLSLLGSDTDGLSSVRLRNATTDNSKVWKFYSIRSGTVHMCFQLKCDEHISVVECSNKWLLMEELQA